MTPGTPGPYRTATTPNQLAPAPREGGRARFAARRSARAWPARIGAGLVATFLLAGCTADPPATPSGAGSTPALRLAAFSSCADALARLKAAARENVGRYGFDAGLPNATGEEVDGALQPDGGAQAREAAAAPAAGAARQGESEYSRTNTHEAGVDEPDVVKTDGRRIVTVSGGVLRVVDAARRVVVGSLELEPGTGFSDFVVPQTPDLLLHGDRALVLFREADRQILTPDVPAVPADPDRPVKPGLRRLPPEQDSTPVLGVRTVLIDLAGQPRILAEHRFDGNLLSARQVGATARVVVKSAPRFAFPRERVQADQISANRRVIERATAADWLPRYETTEGGNTTSGQVPCDRLSHPAIYSGGSLLTVLTFGLAASRLGDGDPVTIVADGETVYGTGSSLYVATDQRWRVRPGVGGPQAVTGVQTQIFKFDTSGTGRPRYVAGGTVPGWLLNQYAMSEWDGRLRVATTLGAEGNAGSRTESAVYVLRQRGAGLSVEGRIGGLGKGERIYSVRFVGPVGYVVTFRQVDPLYTLDLKDPARPRLAGELKITGYSAYLHPAGDGRLIGVGQEASTEGRTQGMQVSLFDVSDLAHPKRLARHHVPAGYSAAEFDPHAFLYWPADRLLVLPMSANWVQRGATSDQGDALVLRVEADGFATIGALRQDDPGRRTSIGGNIQRSMVIDGVLWTLSATGLQASDPSTLDKLAWIPLS